MVFVHFQEDPLSRYQGDRRDGNAVQKAVRDMVLEEQGVLHMGGLQSGAVLVNLSPVGAALTTEIEEKVTDLNERRHYKMGYLDATLLSSEIGGGEGGKHTIAVAGKDDIYISTRRLLDVLGTTKRVGETPAAAQHVKIAQTIKLCSDMVGTVEALYYGHRAGLDLDGLLELIEGDGYGRRGAALGSLALRRDFQPALGAMTVAGFVDYLGATLGGIESLCVFPMPACLIST